MGCYNPRWIFSINTCGRYGTSNNEQPHVTNTSRFSPPPLWAPPSLLHAYHQHAPVIGRASLRNRRPQRSYTGSGWIRFLGSDLRDCSICFIKLFTRTRLPLHRLCTEAHHIYLKLHQSTCCLQESTTMQEVTYVFKSRFMPCMLICVGMILLDNLLQCFLFIAMLHLYLVPLIVLLFRSAMHYSCSWFIFRLK
jgi:hypothetical protein